MITVVNVSNFPVRVVESVAKVVETLLGKHVRAQRGELLGLPRHIEHGLKRRTRIVLVRCQNSTPSAGPAVTSSIKF
jgi:hypothetical protein